MRPALLTSAAGIVALNLLWSCSPISAVEGVAGAGATAVGAAADVGETTVGAAADIGETTVGAAADVGEAVAEGAGSLVDVNLGNVLIDLADTLNLDRAIIPLNAPIPIPIAANVCGVSVEILTRGRARCDARTVTNELAQLVRQRIAAGGSVGAGAQGDSTPTTEGTETNQQQDPPEEPDQTSQL